VAGLRRAGWHLADHRGTRQARHSTQRAVELGIIDAYPQIVSAGLARGWTWLAHGLTNSILHTGLGPDEERRVLAKITEDITAATGRRPVGWMGPGLTETHHTPQLLSDLGFQYVLDWTNDDQPYLLTIPGMLSVPYSVELNDLLLFAKGLTGPDFVQIVTDQFEQLRADSTTGGRVMALALHPFVIGQPFRHKYLEQALSYPAAQPDAWLTTTDEIAAHYLTQGDVVLTQGDVVPARDQPAMNAE
jgi:peptidoglycan/xylan/chitin deacetylase (PgdA/CDA1 family)